MPFLPEVGKFFAKRRMECFDKASDPNAGIGESLAGAVFGKACAVAGMLANPIEYLNETLNPNSEMNKQRKAEGKE